MRSSQNPPLLGTTIWSTPSELQCITRGTTAQVCHMKLWITGPCYVQETSYLTVGKHHAMHLISIAGTMALPTRYYMHPCGILQTHGLPHQEKHYQC